MCILNLYNKEGHTRLCFGSLSTPNRLFLVACYVTVSVHFIAQLACNLSIRHAKHARLLTTEKDYKNEMACVFSIMALDRDGYYSSR